MKSKRHYWFNAKRDGLGWGVPATWQGWTVLIVVLVLVTVDAIFILPRYGQTVFYVLLGIIAASFVLISWLTGEPPRWRSGDE